MTGEMVAMLIFDMILELKDRISKEDKKKIITFKKFQKQGQLDRIKYLTGFQCIDNALFEPFDVIRRIRREYLHLYLKDQNNLQKDAKTCYAASFNLVNSALSHKLRSNGIDFTPALLEYLMKKGIAK